MPTATGAVKPRTFSKSRAGRRSVGMRWNTRRTTAAISQSLSTSARTRCSSPCRSSVSTYSCKSAYGITTSLGAKARDDLVRVHDVALDQHGVPRAQAQLGHRAHQAEPVQQLLLAAVLDLTKRPLPPDRVVAGDQRREQFSVRGQVGIQAIVLRREEGVRPARRGDERDAPRARGERPRARGAQLEAAAWRGRRRVQLVLADRFPQPAHVAAKPDDPPAE